MTEEELERRFWKRLRDGKTMPHMTTPCWEWTGGLSDKGYGTLHDTDRRVVKAHRKAFQLAHGEPVPDDRDVLHHCDNPPCCRPDHLYLGSNADNMADKVERGRQPRGEGNTVVVLTEEQVLDIRARFSRRKRNGAALAREFGVAKRTVYDIVERRTWNWL